MRVVKRDGTSEEVAFDKISARIRKLMGGKLANVDIAKVTSLVVTSMHDGISTSKIDELAAEACVSLLTEHPEYGSLASRILVSNWHKSTTDDVLETFEQLASVLSVEFLETVREHAQEFQSMLDYKRDYDFDYFAIKTLEKIYCGRVNGVLVERPQHMYLRVAIALHGKDLKKVKETYTLLSKKKFTHASPTLFNAGLKVQQLASCFLGHVGDSLGEICDSWRDISHISKLGGGIGVHVHAVRSKGAPIRSTNGTSDGIIPMLRVKNSIVSYVNQCFVPDTTIFTSKGLRRIEDMSPGNRVLTRDGTFKAVREVFARHVENEPTLSISVKSGCEPVECTLVHDIFARKSGGSPGFYQAKDLEVGDIVAYPIPVDVHPLAESENLPSCHERGEDFAKRFLNDLEDVYLGLSKEQTKAFVLGALQSCTVELEGPDDSSFVAIRHEDTHVLAILWYLLLRLGVLAARGKGWLKLPAHPIVRSIASVVPTAACEFEERDGMLWTPIEKIESKRFTGNVYDLSVEQNHNYTTGCGLVHNSGRRKGSMAVYLSPHHPDVMDFLELRRPGGDENMRCRDLFLAMWVPDLFMKRVEEDGEWSLFDPFQTPGLDDLCGAEYEALYFKYESEGLAKKTVKARDVWNAILRSQIETGTPYMLYKDSCNQKSNQKNLGTIKCSNLCSEILEYTSREETAVCNLASISLPAFVKQDTKTFDFADLLKVTKVAAKNLDRVIDVNVYPIPQAERSNLRHRPIGIGVQGLADVFVMMRMPFDSPEASALNKKIFATMYFAAIEASAELAAEHGPYESYSGSPASQGFLQYDLWNVIPEPGGHLDWQALKKKVSKHGLRNSLSIAVMPTASTAQVFGNNESIEPFTSLLYTRRTLAGEFVVINKYLVDDLVAFGLWTPALKDEIISKNGSIQSIQAIPQHIRDLYKTAWDLSQKSIIDQAADRGPYVCQSQSLNLFVAEPTYPKLTSMHFYAWRRGLKTGMYYLRSKPASSAKKITLAPSSECLMCSS